MTQPPVHMVMTPGPSPKPAKRQRSSLPGSTLPPGAGQGKELPSRQDSHPDALKEGRGGSPQVEATPAGSSRPFSMVNGHRWP